MMRLAILERWLPVRRSHAGVDTSANDSGSCSVEAVRGWGKVEEQLIVVRAKSRYSLDMEVLHISLDLSALASLGGSL